MSHARGKEGVKEGVEDTERVAAFFRALSARAERDPQLAASLLELLEESGLLSTAGAGTERVERRKRVTPQAQKPADAEMRDGRTEILDPFKLWRAQGEEALRQALERLELRELRAVVRAHRLDPARVSSRWSARERVITLIMEQVKARLNHGRAFERV
jgi:hypothetical protein